MKRKIGSMLSVPEDGAAHAKHLARTSLLAALALVLSFVETMIPLPVALPGVKLGLSNVAVLIALYAIDVPCAVVVAVVKVLVAGFIFGSPMMIAYSAAGTFLAFCGMLICRKIPMISIIVTSIVAAILHNVGQLLVAAAMLHTWSVMIYFAPLALAACITGAITGIVARSVLPFADVSTDPPIASIKADQLSALKLSRGAYVAFLGVNGSGKSSFARALAARDDLGCVVLACQDADSQIVAQTVRDDVAYGLECRRVAQKRMATMVDAQLARVGLAGMEDASIDSLSGGQKQLVVLAGLAILCPNVIIFDETTSMMDDSARETFEGIVDDLTRCGTCVICITQDFNEVLRADRVALFSQGEIRTVATPEHLWTHQELLHEVGLRLRSDLSESNAHQSFLPLERGQATRLEPACGQIVGLIGKNASGKSTALGQLAEVLGDRAAIVRQRPECQLFAQTAFEDVAFGARNAGCSDEETEKRVTEVLTYMGLDVDAARTRSPFEYSGGEKRLLAIAGALVLEREILLLDEPTAGLDPAHSARIWSLVALLRERGYGIVVVSHDVDMLSSCADKVFLLSAPKADAVLSSEIKDEEQTGQESSASGSGGFSFGVFRNRTSFAHRLDPRAKVVFSILFLLACVFAEGIFGMILLVAAVVFLLLLSRSTPFEVWRSFRTFLPLIIFVGIFDILFVSEGDMLFEFGVIHVTSGGLWFAFESVIRFLCALIGASQLMITTRPIQLADALDRLLSPLRYLGVRVDDLTFGVNATFRFIPLLNDEFNRIRCAQADRGAEFSRGSLRARVRSFIPVLVPLFASVFSRADTLARAIYNRSIPEDQTSSSRMVKRHTCIRTYHIRRADVIYMIVGFVLVVAAVLSCFI